MRVHWFQHVPFEGLGSIEPWMRMRGHALTVTRFYAQECPPPDAHYDWLIVMGGPMGVYQEKPFPWLSTEKQAIRAALAANRRVLGICLGAQLIACVLGAQVRLNPQKEIGWHPVDRLPDAGSEPLFSDFPARFEAFHWHADTYTLPPGALHVARSQACDQQAFVLGQRVVGLQFHLETTAATCADLIQHARQDIEPGAFVQDETAMLAQTGRYAGLNRLMDALLARMEAS